MKALLLVVLCFISGCASVSQERTTLVLSYDELGPQVIAHEVVGKGWWQWQDHGGSRPMKYDVKVVVYQDILLEDVKKQYPVIPEKLQDYRYISYTEVMNYLDEKIKEDIMAEVTILLKSTRYKILIAFE